MYLTFVTITSILILPTAIFLVRSMFKNFTKSSSDHNLEILQLKNQLLQITKDEKIGLLDKNDDLIKISVSRKLIKLHDEVADEKKIVEAPKKITTWASLFIVSLCLIGSHVTYVITDGHYFQYFQSNQINILNIGNNSKPSEHQKQLSQEAVEKILKKNNDAERFSSTDLKFSDLAQLVRQLKTVLDDRPNDLQGHELLVKNSARIGDFFTARRAQKQVLVILASDARSSDFANYADLCIIAANGYVSTEAAMAIKKALEIDYNNSQANFYLSLLFLQDGATSRALKIWKDLLANEPSSSKLIKMLIPKIELLSAKLAEKLAGNQQTNSEFHAIRMAFLNLLKTFEERLDKEQGSTQNWKSLIQSYQNLNYMREAETNVIKMRSLFSSSSNR